MNTAPTIAETAPGRSQTIQAVPGYALNKKRPRKPKRIETEKEQMARYRKDPSRWRGEEGKLYCGR